MKEYMADKPAGAAAQPPAAPASQAPAPWSVLAPGGGPAAPGGSPLAEKVIESSTAASDAAKAASEAATAAQNRPNVNQTNNYNVTVQAPEQPGALEMRAALDKALRDREKQKEADLRGSFLNQPNY